MSENEPSQTFEAAITELESIVGKMESEHLPLDQSLLIYKRGVEILKNCHTSLQEAEQQIKILSEQNLLKDFKETEE